jgi:probable F420-dependent oxidoreductase
MATDRRFRFGVGPAGLTGRPPHATQLGWTELARWLEDHGYSALNVGDHLDDRLAPIAALAVAGAATTRLRLGTFMLSNDYRHPAVLAKELATIDVLSAGRLEAGIGAGWLAADYGRAGIEFDRPGPRIERLAEAVRVLKALFEHESATFEGKHYRLDGLPGLPRPVQAPRPPIVMGGGGRRILRLAAREADIVALNVSLRPGRLGAPPGESASAAAVAERIGWVRAAAGPRFSDLELQIYVHAVAITTDRDAAAEQIGARLGLSPEEVVRSPHVLIGTADQIADDLRRRREQFGISYVGVSGEHIRALEPVVSELAGT